MNTWIWNHWTEFCMLVHTICRQVLFLGNFWNERGNWFTPKMHAVFYINWTNNLWKNENIYYRVFRRPLFSSTMPGKGRSSPWWNHFQVVNGDFRLVQCIHCNKLVRRGKAGCSSQETSNSGMATHMRSRHRDQAIQVVHFKMNKVSIDITLLSRCREHLILRERQKLSLLTRKMRLSAALFHFSSWDQGLIEQSGRNW